ncbi:hypothetical protein ACFY8K_31410 [Streptomyces misionensis]|uniref:hypothetical protein n=1 Tax=Streptomyces misionensis TaxID=67331 RepID=UPI00367F8E41
MELAFLSPLYEHRGCRASAYADLSRQDEDTAAAPLTRGPPDGLVHWGTPPRAAPLPDLAGEDPLSPVWYVPVPGETGGPAVSGTGQ